MDEEKGLEMDWEMAHVPFFDRFKFRNIRKWKGLTQTDLAVLLGNSPHERQNIAKWEKGTRIPHLSSVRRVAEALGVRPSDLMSTHQELQKSEEIYEQVMKARGYIQTDAALNKSRSNVIKRDARKAVKKKWDDIKEKGDKDWHAKVEKELIARGRDERMAQFISFTQGEEESESPYWVSVSDTNDTNDTNYSKDGDLEPDS